MIKELYQKALSRNGKNYELDSRIPNSLLVYSLFNRVIMLFRGFLKLRKRVFLGKKTTFLNKKNIVFGNNVTIEQNCFIDAYSSKKIEFGNNVKIGAFSSVSSTSHMSKYGIGLKIGSNSGIGRFTEFGASGGIEIGEDVIMGSYISFHSENHNFNDVSKPIREQGVTSKGIKLGNNIWVGAKVTFLDGCEVGNNCVIAAGSVVKGIFSNNVVIGGVPAKVLKNM
ncbi:acyltransferase [Polaribacter pectinis]|uniref:Acyltransferase n=1 Tax=Polaribacter pectinis TaxID=2738844 RepID=A0A7G9L984_9FLAO|nr:acyltransferase [Polaribacter pectinis]QNM85183.1 acyltransferase [Polaribacter pectinis]